MSQYRPYPKDLIDELDILAIEQSRLKNRDDGLAAKIQQLASLLCEEYPEAKKGDVVLGARLLAVVGSGAFGNVWRAQPEDPTAKQIAVKIVQAPKLGLGLNLHAFRRGVDAMRRLNEGSGTDEVVKLLGVDEAATAFSMPLVSRGDLVDARCNWRDIDQIVEFFEGVCRAVKYAHQKEIRHRDIKPRNVLVDNDPRVGLVPVLTDFDISDLMWKQTLSTASLANGTPFYSAPVRFTRILDGQCSICSQLV